MEKRKTKSIQKLDKGILRLDKFSVPYRLNRSKRARYLRLTINRLNEVILTLPTGCSLDHGLRFIKKKSEWLQRHLEKAAAPVALSDFLKENGFISLDGESVPIVWKGEGEATVIVSRESAEVQITWDPSRHDENDLKALLRQFASETLARRTRELAARHDLAVNQVSVRDQLSRWGSCSAKRNISLNWRLILLPPEIKDYVIWHELAHLLEMNHSPQFWKELTALDPDARQHDNALSKITNRIMSLGRDET